MGYDEFRAEYDAVMHACVTARLDLDGLDNAVSRLSEHRDRLAPGDRARADGDIAELVEILDLARRTPYASSPAFSDASRALSRATTDTGSPAERIARAQRGIEEIRAIANRVTDPAERHGVLRTTEPLAMLIESLRTTREGTGG